MSDATNHVEKVAKAIDDVPSSDVVGFDSRAICRVFARAAIAVVVQEAKRVLLEDCHDDMTRDEEAEAIRKAFLGNAK